MNYEIKTRIWNGSARCRIYKDMDVLPCWELIVYIEDFPEETEQSLLDALVGYAEDWIKIRG